MAKKVKVGEYYSKLAIDDKEASSALDRVADKFKLLAEFMDRFVSKTVEATKTSVELIAGLASAVSSIFSAGSTAATTSTAAIVAGFVAVGAAIAAVIYGATKLVKWLASFPIAAMTAMAKVPGMIGDAVKKTAGAIATATKAVFATLATVAQAAVATAISAITRGPSALISGLTSVAAGTVAAVGSVFDSVTNGLSKIESQLSGVAVALGGFASKFTSPIEDAANKFGILGFEVKNLAKQAGIGTAAFTALAYAASQVGVNNTQLAGASETATGKVGAAKKDPQIAKQLMALGLSVKELANADAESRLTSIATAIGSIAKPAKQAAIATDLLGSSGMQLVEMFQKGKSWFEATRREAERFGLVMDGPAVDAAIAYTRAQERLTAATTGLWNQIGAIVAPIVADVVERTTEIVAAITSWVRANKETIATVFQVASAVGSAAAVIGAIASGVGGLSVVFAGLSAIAGTVAAAITAVGGVVAAVVTPLGLLFVAAAGAAAAFGRMVPWMAIANKTMDAGTSVWNRYSGSVADAYDQVVTTLGKMVAYVQGVIGGINDAIRGGRLDLAVTIATTGMQTAWAKGMSKIADVSNATFGAILNSLSTGDWRTAADTAMKGLELAFQLGVGKLESVWYSLQGTFDSVFTWLRKTWNDVVSGMATQLDRLLSKVQMLLESVAQYDPTGKTEGVLNAINRGRIGLGSTPGEMSTANAQLDTDQAARQAQREAAAALAQATRDTEIARLRSELATAAQKADEAALKRVEELEKKLRDSIAAAQIAKREAIASQQAVGDGIGGGIRMPSIGGELLGGQLNVGTSSGFAAMRLSGGGQTSLQILNKATQETAKNTKTIAENMTEGLAIVQ